MQKGTEVDDTVEGKMEDATLEVSPIADESTDPMIQLEEDIMLSRVDRGLAAEELGYAVGESGLSPLRDFLNGHLPPFLKAVVGHTTTPDDGLSPEAAVLVVDQRYPVLKEDLDGFALVMLHSVIAVIETESLLTANGLADMLGRAEADLRASRTALSGDREDRAALFCGFACRSSENPRGLSEVYRKATESTSSWFDITILRLSAREAIPGVRRGIELRKKSAGTYEKRPRPEEEEDGYACRPTCLSDFWHNIVVRVSAIFLSRNLSDAEVEDQFGKYPSWSSSLNEVIQARRGTAPEERAAEGEDPFSYP